ncbi:hypothetical protein Hypma_011902 [Hypsizygus marmoreus]|uniref:Transcription factor Iwr1 domain-containing protein n=1 Tax=Hypsizygus marmoreus TaxID=39966 RepID=A0A369JNU6_HYPMA|nr:hypothetical protein Hypma_011902 [Hypsizygus marmoreus]
MPKEKITAKQPNHSPYECPAAGRSTPANRDEGWVGVLDIKAYRKLKATEGTSSERKDSTSTRNSVPTQQNSSSNTMEPKRFSRGQHNPTKTNQPVVAPPSAMITSGISSEEEADPYPDRDHGSDNEDPGENDDASDDEDAVVTEDDSEKEVKLDNFLDYGEDYDDGISAETYDNYDFEFGLVPERDLDLRSEGEQSSEDEVSD